MIHVVFQEADIAALKRSFELDESLEGEIILIRDDFAVGPLGDIYSEEGIAFRNNWWNEILTEGGYPKPVTGVIDDQKTVQEIKEKLNARAPGVDKFSTLEDDTVKHEDSRNIEDSLDENDDPVLWIWAAQNKHDVAGYYWLMSQLKDFQGRIYILYLNNLPFINEKGHIFYPTSLFEIQAREFLKAKKLARVITPSEFEVDPDEWAKLCNENKGVRTLEGGKKLIQHDYDYYDAELMKFITPDWQRVHKLFTVFFSKSKNTTGDAYLQWRLKKMIAEGKIDAQGEPRNIKEFEVKLKES